jgi:hypothetical protein
MQYLFIYAWEVYTFLFQICWQNLSQYCDNSVLPLLDIYMDLYGKCMVIIMQFTILKSIRKKTPMHIKLLRLRSAVVLKVKRRTNLSSHYSGKSWIDTNRKLHRKLKIGHYQNRGEMRWNWSVRCFYQPSVVLLQVMIASSARNQGNHDGKHCFTPIEIYSICRCWWNVTLYKCMDSSRKKIEFICFVKFRSQLAFIMHFSV